MFKNLYQLVATIPDDKACRDYLAKNVETVCLFALLRT